MPRIAALLMLRSTAKIVSAPASRSFRGFLPASAAAAKPVIGFLSVGSAEAFGSNIRALCLGLSGGGFVTREQLDSPHTLHISRSAHPMRHQRVTKLRSLTPPIGW